MEPPELEQGSSARSKKALYLTIKEGHKSKNKRNLRNHPLGLSVDVEYSSIATKC
ncbi:hypothetical protein CJ030_MR1G021679 [Morella rubra]|uniref:Uncharacterized protein n=1 Tax=Morella rubra TaxID=262757 RepID=A0A6A1WSM5_9ROSI|nr:hypothetical protein CJ030_MR1G021679 [Morella rubra]